MNIVVDTGTALFKRTFRRDRNGRFAGGSGGRSAPAARSVSMGRLKRAVDLTYVQAETMRSRMNDSAHSPLAQTHFARAFRHYNNAISSWTQAASKTGTEQGRFLREGGKAYRKGRQAEKWAYDTPNRMRPPEPKW